MVSLRLPLWLAPCHPPSSLVSLKGLPGGRGWRRKWERWPSVPPLTWKREELLRCPHPLPRGGGRREAHPIPRSEIMARSHELDRAHTRVTWKRTCRCTWPRSLVNRHCRRVTSTGCGTPFKTVCATTSPHRRNHSSCVHTPWSPARFVCPATINGQWTGSRRPWKSSSPHAEAIMATGWWSPVICLSSPGVQLTCQSVRRTLPSVWWSSWKPITVASEAIGFASPRKGGSTPKEVVSASSLRSRMSSDTCSSRRCGSTSAGGDSTSVRGRQMEQGRRRRRRRVLGGTRSPPPLHRLNHNLPTTSGCLTIACSWSQLVKLSCWQLNQHKSVVASMDLQRRLEPEEAFIALFQEPYTRGGQAMHCPSGAVCFQQDSSDGSRNRSAIYLSGHLSAWLVPELTDSDTVTVSVSTEFGLCYFISTYMPGDGGDPPPPLVQQAIRRGEREVVGLIIGGDANAHNTVWGSSDTNARGEVLRKFIVSTRLVVCNRGYEPTFVVENKR